MVEGKIVMPGELISEREEHISYAYVEKGKTYSTVVGLYSNGKIVPLEGPYDPLAEDTVVGVITEIKFAGYSVDINYAFPAFLSNRESKEKLALGDAIIAKVLSVNEVKDVELFEAKRLPAGSLVRVSPVKVPRIIGKRNSMIDMLQSSTGCQIFVGRNGYVWISGKGNDILAEKALRIIEVQAHTQGLTDRVAAFLREHR
ncbi:MAG: KH domain-containing protein [Candidatus Micrarchaeota archaeon]|nr:KH domain-containing protein [Candidatus Micrarchaeota archaeon]